MLKKFSFSSKVLSFVMVIIFGMSLVALPAFASDSKPEYRYFDIEFENDSDFVAAEAGDSRFFWKMGEKTLVPVKAAVNGLNAAKITPKNDAAGFNNYLLIDKSNAATAAAEPYVVEFKIKRDSMNKIQVVGTSNDNKVLFDVNLDGNQWRNKNGRIAESNQAGEWDTVYVLIDPASHKYTLYVNDKTLTTTATPNSDKRTCDFVADTSAALVNISFRANYREGYTTKNDMYLDYIKTYSAAEMYVPKYLDLNFDGDSNFSKTENWDPNKPSKSTDEKPYNAIKLQGGTADVTQFRLQLGYNARHTNIKNITNPYVIETRMKITSTAGNPYIDLDFRNSDNANPKYGKFYTGNFSGRNYAGTAWAKDAANVANVIPDSNFRPDIVPSKPDFDMGWTTIYISVNPTDGTYKFYADDKNTFAEGTFYDDNVTRNISFLSFYVPKDNCIYVDYIKIHDASEFVDRIPASSQSDDIALNFDGYAIGDSAENGLIKFCDGKAAGTASVVADPDASNAGNKCLEIAPTSDDTAKTLAVIPVFEDKCVMEFKTYFTSSTGFQIRLRNSSNKFVSLTQTTTNAGANIVNFGKYPTNDSAITHTGTVNSTWYGLLNGWNKIRIVYGDSTTECENVYIYINDVLASKASLKYELSTIEIVDTAAPFTDKLYIDDFSVKHQMDKEIVQTGISKNGENQYDYTYTVLNIGGAAYTEPAVILGIYDADGNLEKSFLKKVAFNEGIKKYSVVFTGINIPAGGTGKVFFFNDMDSITPLTQHLNLVTE